MAIKGITSCLWYDTQAEDAAKLYCSVFKNSKMGKVTHYGKEGFEIHGQPEGKVMTVDFELEGSKFVALNGGPHFKFSEAISFQIHCETQDEIDYYWSKLTAGGGQEESVRLAEGQVRPVVAGGADRVGRDFVERRRRQVAARHQGVPADEEVRHRGAAERLRSGRPMSLTLYYHPLSSFCHKALIALYENATPFTPHVVDLGNAASTAEFKAIWPIGKFPVLRDAARDRLVPESSIIIEYLDQYYPGATRFLPADPELARQTRFRDRFYDLHIHLPMQKIVTDRLRPAGKNDPHGVDEARKTLNTALGIVDRAMADSSWAMGDTFTLADCSAAPALFYANVVSPLVGPYNNLDRYLKRLLERPSYTRVIEEARPYFDMLPKA